MGKIDINTAVKTNVNTAETPNLNTTDKTNGHGAKENTLSIVQENLRNTARMTNATDTNIDKTSQKMANRFLSRYRKSNLADEHEKIFSNWLHTRYQRRFGQDTLRLECLVNTLCHRELDDV